MIYVKIRAGARQQRYRRPRASRRFDLEDVAHGKASCTDYWRHRARWRLPCRISARQLVHGLKRRSSSFNAGRVDYLYQDPHEQDLRFAMHYVDLTDATNLIRIVRETQPDEVYNLAQSHVQVSFETPEYTANAEGVGTLRLLEAIRILNMERRVRFYQASTSALVQQVLKRDTTVLSVVTVCSCEALCLLDRGELSGGVRDSWRNDASSSVTKTALFEVRLRCTIFGNIFTSKWPPSDWEIGS
jgi:hypothetical protein